METTRDEDTDYNLVATRIRVKLKIVYKGRSKKHWNTDSLKDSEKSMVFIGKLERQQEEINFERRRLQLKGKIKDTAEEMVGYKTGKRRR